MRRVHEASRAAGLLERVDSSDVVVRLLGQIDAVRSGEMITMSSPTQRRLTALLGIRLGTTVPTLQICDLLGISPGALQTTVSRLRRVLGHGVVETTSRGYRLDVVTDAMHFEALADSARSVSDFDAALGLWLGPAVDEFAHENWAGAFATRMNELRNTVIEDRAALLISAGRCGAAVADLEAHVATQPLRDRAQGLLMEALAAEGRQADALRVYRVYRRHLADHVGTEPSQRVTQLDRRIATDWASPSATQVDSRSRPDAGHSAESSSPAHRDVEGERRQVTMLSLEFDNAAATDPEELLDSIDDRIASAVQTIGAEGGEVIRVASPGLLACFGYPTGHEDAGRRALRSALAVVTSNTETGTTARAGVHSGIVVVRPDAGGGQSVVGPVPIAVLRIRDRARPGEVLLSGHTLEVTGGRIETRTLATNVELGSGVTSDLHVLTGVVDRSTGSKAATTFVGRDLELSVIDDRVRKVLSGTGAAITVIGEAGIGKSRLLAEACDTWVDEIEWITACASPHHADIPYRLLLDLFVHWYRWSPDVGAEQRAVDLAGTLGGDIRHANVLALLFGSESSTSLQIEQSDVCLAACAWLVAATAERSVVLVLDDAHWSDGSTLEILAAWISVIDATAALLIVAARPDFEPSWASAPHHTLIRPAPLDQATVRDLIAQRLTSRPDEQVIVELAERSDGIPLFAEELAAAHGAALGGHELPMTLQDLLNARLQNAGPARRIAQLASVIGREFDVSVLRAVSGQTIESIRSDLEHLVDHELVRPSVTESGTRFEFRHALVHRAAYESLLRRSRRDLHRRVAIVLSQEGGTDAATLALHWHAAGEPVTAAASWEVAARAALHKAAVMPAARMFELALRSLERSGTVSADDEVRLLLGRIEAMSMGVGWVSREVEELLVRVRRRHPECSDMSVEFETLHRLHFTAMMGGHIRTGVRLAEDLVRHAAEHRDRRSVARADMAACSALMNAGELRRALTHAQRAVEALDASGAPALDAAHEVQTRGFAAVIALLIDDDRFDASSRWISTVDAVLDLTDDPVTAMFAHMARMIFAHHAGHDEDTVEEAGELESIATTFSIPTLQALAVCYRGQAVARLGDRRGLDRQLDGLRGLTDQGVHLGQIGWWSERADLLLGFGDVSAAREAIDHAGSRPVFLEQKLYMPRMLQVRARVAASEGAPFAAIGGWYERAAAVAHECGMHHLRDALRTEAATQL